MTQVATRPTVERRLRRLEETVRGATIFTPANISILPNGVPYFPGGVSVGGGGGTPESVTNPVVPVPTSMIIASAGNEFRTYLDVAWSAPTDMGSDQVVAYEIQLQQGTTWNGSQAPQFVRFTAGLSVRLEPVEPSKSYVVRVRSITKLNTVSDWLSGSGSSATDVTAPSAPTNLVLTAGFKSLTAKWNENTEADVVNGNGTYQVDVATNGSFSANLRQFVMGVTSMTLTDLGTQATYYVRVRAVDKWGNVSGNSSTQNVTTLRLPPGELTDGIAPSSAPVAVVTGGIGFLMVEWDPIVNNDPVEYDVHISTSSGFTPTPSTLSQSVGSGTFAVIRTMPNGSALNYATTYYVKIVTVDIDGTGPTGTQGSGSPVKAGSGDISTVGGNQVHDGSPPGSSPTPTVTGGIGFLFVDWSPVANNDVVTYEVHLSTTTGFTPSGATKVGETTDTFQMIRKDPGTGVALVPGTTYYVKLIAKDLDGSAAASAQGSGAPLQILSTDFNVNIAGGNLLTNSSFEDASTGTANPPPAWTLVQHIGSPTYGGAQWKYGTRSFKFTPDGSEAILRSPSGTSGVPVKPGDKLCGSFWSAASVGSSGITARVRIYWWKSDGTASAVTATVDGATLTEGGANVFSRAKLEGAVAPSDAAFASLACDFPVTTNGNFIYVDGAQLEFGDICTAYAPRPDEIIPGTVGTTELAALAVTAAKIAANTITAAQIAAGTITATEIAAATITGAKIAAGTITASNIATETITTDKLIVGNFENSCEDPGFESQSVQTNIPASASNVSWFGTTQPGNPWVYKVDSTNARNGKGYASRLGDGVTSSQIDLTNQNAIDIRPNDEVYVEAWVKSTAGGNGTISIGVWWIDKTGATVSVVAAASSTNVTSYTLLSGRLVAPANAVYARPYMNLTSHTAGTWYTDDWYFKKTIVAAFISDATITNAKINDLSASKITTGTINAQTITLGTSGGAGVIQSSTYSAGIATPARPALSTATTGGTLAASTLYEYGITATTAGGETPLSPLNSIATGSGTSTNTATLSWSAVTNATGYKIYGRSSTSGTFGLIATVGAVTNYTDTGSPAPGVAPPSLDTTLAGWQIQGDGTSVLFNTTVYGTLRSAPSGARTEISQTVGLSYIGQYSGDANEASPVVYASLVRSTWNNIGSNVSLSRDSHYTYLTSAVTLPGDLVTTFTLNVSSTVGTMPDTFPSSGTLLLGTGAAVNASALIYYTGKTATSFTGCTVGVGVGLSFGVGTYLSRASKQLYAFLQAPLLGVDGFSVKNPTMAVYSQSIDGGGPQILFDMLSSDWSVSTSGKIPAVKAATPSQFVVQMDAVNSEVDLLAGTIQLGWGRQQVSNATAATVWVPNGLVAIDGYRLDVRGGPITGRALQKPLFVTTVKNGAHAGGATTYTYVLSALNAAGETIGSAQVTVANCKATLDVNNSVTVSGTQFGAGAASWRLYGRVGGSLGLLYTILTSSGGGQVFFPSTTDDGSVTPNGAITPLATTTILPSTMRGVETGRVLELQDYGGQAISYFDSGGGLQMYNPLQVVGMAAPTGVAVAQQGTTGATTYSYKVSSFNAQGEQVAAAVQITNGKATLDATSYVQITWNRVAGATGYRIYGRTSGAWALMVTILDSIGIEDGNNPSNVSAPSSTQRRFRDDGTLTPSGAVPTTVTYGTSRIAQWPGQAFSISGAATTWPAKAGFPFVLEDSAGVRAFMFGSDGAGTEGLFMNSAAFTTGTWFRIIGGNGVFWQTYGGGWNMTDSTYMRCYGDKVIMSGNAIMGNSAQYGSSFAAFMHVSRTATDSYCAMQDAAGFNFYGHAGGQRFEMRENNATTLFSASVSGGDTDMRIGNRGGGVLPPVLGGTTIVIATSSGELGRASSSMLVKTNIDELDNSGEQNPVWHMRPVRFHWDPTKVRNAHQYPALAGLIAEEVAVVAPDGVHYDLDGNPESLNDWALLSYLVDAVHYLRDRIDVMDDKPHRSTVGLAKKSEHYWDPTQQAIAVRRHLDWLDEELARHPFSTHDGDEELATTRRKDAVFQSEWDHLHRERQKWERKHRTLTNRR